MYLHHVKTAVFAQLCPCTVGFYNLHDYFFWHGLHRPCRHHDIAGSVSHLACIMFPSHAGKSAVHSAVGQLDVSICACVMDSPCSLCHALLHTIGIQLKLLVMGFSGCRMDNGLPICHNPCAAHGLFFQISNHLRGKVALRRNHAGTGRRCYDSVLQSYITNSKR